MPSILTTQQVKDWAWSWARRLHEDITLTPTWLNDIAGLSAPLPEDQRIEYQTVLTWTATAYFEFLRGRWSQARAQRQIQEAQDKLAGAFTTS